MKWPSLHYRILIGMGIGLAIGLAMHHWGDRDSSAFRGAIWWLDLFGKDIFVGGLKMIIAPLIFASIVAGISTLPTPHELGSIGVKTLGYYMTTTALAVAIGIVAVSVVQPGHMAASQRVRLERLAVLDEHKAEFESQTRFDADAPEHAPAFRAYIAEVEGSEISQTSFGANWDRIQQAEDQGPGEMFRRQILLPVLSNPFTSLSESPPNSLGIIFFAILTGLACLVAGAAADTVVSFFRGVNEVMMTITLWIMQAAPLAIGCIIASLVATLGYDALQALAGYCAVVIGGIGIHICALLAIVGAVGRMSPGKFLYGIRDAWIIAFTTTSSAATLPITLHCTKKNLRVDEKIADFSLPIGATVNMDGTALYEGVAVIFLIQMYGGLADVPIALDGMKLFIIFITAVLASVGAAAVPSAGLITMAIVAGSVGLPLHYIFMIYAVDHFLDMFRTSTNVMGDMAGAVVVNRLERGRLGG